MVFGFLFDVISIFGLFCQGEIETSQIKASLRIQFGSFQTA